MKNIIIAIIIVLGVWGIYSFSTKEKLPDQNTPAAKMFRDYEAVVIKYEKQGIKSQEDMVRLQADMQVFMTTSKNVTIPAEDASYYLDKGKELNARVMKLVQNR